MPEPALDLRRFHRLGALAAVLAGLLMLAGAEPAPAADPEDESARAALLSRLAERWEVLPLRDGYALRPRETREELRLLDLGPDGVAVDGEEVDEDALRELLGDGADDVLALAEEVVAEAEQGGEEPGVRRLAEAERALARQVEREVRRHEAEIARHAEEIARVERERVRRDRPDRGDQRVSFGSGLTIEEDESARDVVVLLGSAVVLGEVRGSATAVGGSVEVDGEVTGDVVAVGGSVSLGPRARVRGDVVSVGGSIDRDPAARVDGQVTEVSVGPAFDKLWDGWSWSWPRTSWPGSDWLLGAAGIVQRLGNAVVLALLVLFALWMAPRRSPAIADRLELEPWKALFAGITLEVLYLSVLVFLVAFLAITIIGLPLAALLAILGVVGLLVAFLLGFTGVAVAAGRRLEDRFRVSGRGLAVTALLGVALIQGWSIIGKSLSFLGGPIKWTALLLLFFGFVVKYLAWTAGLGALVLHELAPLPVLPPLAPPAAPGVVDESPIAEPPPDGEEPDPRDGRASI